MQPLTINQVREHQLKKWIKLWLDNQFSSEVINSIFANEIIYKECYGPEYKGINEIQQWFINWTKENKVLEWKIDYFFHQTKATMITWEFKCKMKIQHYDSHEIFFDGSSLVEWDEKNKITFLREYGCKK